MILISSGYVRVLRVGLMRLPAAICLCSLAACGSNQLRQIYDGPEKPASEVATINGAQVGNHTILRGLNETIVIDRVDGHSMFTLFHAPNTEDFPHTVKVLPGKHRIDFKYLHHGEYAFVRLWLVAEAGKSYSPRFQSDRHFVRIVLIDDTTGTETGGIQDSADEPDKPSS